MPDIVGILVISSSVFIIIVATVAAVRRAY